MKKLTALLTIILLLFALTGTAFAEHKTNQFYGDVYVFTPDAHFLWWFLNHSKSNGVMIVKTQTVGLVNKGEVFEVQIAVPMKYSYVCVWYKQHLHYFKLTPHLLGNNFIMFTFRGD